MIPRRVEKPRWRNQGWGVYSLDLGPWQLIASTKAQRCMWSTSNGHQELHGFGASFQDAKTPCGAGGETSAGAYQPRARR